MTVDHDLLYAVALVLVGAGWLWSFLGRGRPRVLTPQRRRLLAFARPLWLVGFGLLAGVTVVELLWDQGDNRVGVALAIFALAGWTQDMEWRRASQTTSTERQPVAETDRS